MYKIFFHFPCKTQLQINFSQKKKLIQIIQQKFFDHVQNTTKSGSSIWKRKKKKKAPFFNQRLARQVRKRLHHVRAFGSEKKLSELRKVDIESNDLPDDFKE